jgi:hypothetical protein
VRSYSSPQTASLGDKVRLAALPLVLATAWLSAAGCAGPQAYVPFEQETKVSAASRWQALQGVAKREQWKVALADSQGYTIVAYSSPAGTLGVRDRIKVELLADRTVVETRTEVEDQGLWQASPGRCDHYAFAREKLLAARIDGSDSALASPGAPRKGTELAAR